MSKSTKKLMKKYEKYTKGKGYVREMERKKQKSFGAKLKFDTPKLKFRQNSK